MPSLEKFTLVRIHGLKSEAGKKLNDGLGVIISNKVTIEDNSGLTTTRYPVRVFALKKGNASRRETLEESGDWSILISTDDKKVKAGNLDPHPQGGQAKACLISAAKKYYGGTSDNKIALFWLEANLTACPEDYKGAMDIADTLRMTGRVSEAAKVAFIISQFIDEADYKNCGMLVPIFCKAQVHLDEAVRLALTIPVDPILVKFYRKDTLELLTKTFEDLCDQYGFTKPEIAHLNLAVTKAYVAMSAEADVDGCEWLATQHYLAGEYWEAMKLHRKAIRLGLPADADVTEALIECQLHCPGMPLENYFLMMKENNRYTCLLHEDLHKMGWNPATHSAYVKDPDDDPVVEIYCETPTDPDDPEVFGELLERLRLEEEQGEG
ncbi:MAG: hypothetical protein SGARI_003056 [Bacillariaceae sp.]